MTAVDYVFLDRATFEKWQENGEFVESFEVFGHFYGTPKRPMVDHLAAGDDVILEIDVQGALAVRKEFPDAVLVFLRPPSREVQRERLLARAGDALDTIERRLAKADAEEAMAGRVRPRGRQRRPGSGRRAGRCYPRSPPHLVRRPIPWNAARR